MTRSEATLEGKALSATEIQKRISEVSKRLDTAKTYLRRSAMRGPQLINGERREPTDNERAVWKGMASEQLWLANNDLVSTHYDLAEHRGLDVKRPRKRARK